MNLFLFDFIFFYYLIPTDGDKHPTLAIAHLMKLSFDEGHRQAICQLGGIHVIANLVEVYSLILTYISRFLHTLLRVPFFAHRRLSTSSTEAPPRTPSAS